ncbi:hypothetical protein D3869_02000 [Azospirillum brasilense]|uniref:Uncharacterized protein n=1 Tax=Azospirillum brasilense TaxID=192 RepID=A0A4D8RA51_AZOBR|nr:hypothetical protein [Azospirillum brasilense]QCO14102.1 hypothetical protein D3869_02000 [Azospirillum brasilense]
MTDGSIGRPEPLVRSAGVVERTGGATDRRKRRQNRQDLQQQEREQQERRDQDEANHKRRRLYDLLFDEIDELDTLNAGQRARIKQNLRAQLANRRPPPHLAPNLAQPPPADEDIERIAAALLEKAVAAHSVDHDHIVAMAAPTHPALPPGQTAENVALANQLRDCLEQRTTTSRRVAVYLRLLLTLEGAFRPHLVVDA